VESENSTNHHFYKQIFVYSMDTHTNYTFHYSLSSTRSKSTISNLNSTLLSLRDDYIPSLGVNWKKNGQNWTLGRYPTVTFCFFFKFSTCKASFNVNYSFSRDRQLSIVSKPNYLGEYFVCQSWPYLGDHLSLFLTYLSIYLYIYLLFSVLLEPIIYA
jgi:hypothetical protein